jgi:molybdenum cofactor cytidylyltransferase
MTGIVLLAAGSSSRLGRPKQNLVFKGKTLVQHALDAAINSGCSPVVVVLGANKETIEPTIGDKPVTVIHNPDWQQGMATSVKAGITQLQKTPDISTAIIMLCDQPFVDALLLQQLLQTQLQTGKGIIACAYRDTLGVPVLFHQEYFAALLDLTGDQGAKKLLAMYPNDVASVDFPKGGVDIDTIADYEGLTR